MSADGERPAGLDDLLNVVAKSISEEEMMRTSANDVIIKVLENTEKLEQFLIDTYGNPLMAHIALWLADHTTLMGITGDNALMADLISLKALIAAMVNVGIDEVLAALKSGTYAEKMEELVRKHVESAFDAEAVEGGEDGGTAERQG